MTRAERAALVDRRLAELYPETPIPLAHRDAYSLLIAVLLSAQSTDKGVNKVTPHLFALADTPEKMMQFDRQDDHPRCDTSDARYRHCVD